MVTPGLPTSPCLYALPGLRMCTLLGFTLETLAILWWKDQPGNAWVEFWCLEQLRKPDSSFAVEIPMNLKLSGVAEILGCVSVGCQEAESCVLSWIWTAAIQAEVEQNGKGSNNGKQTNFEAVHVIWWMQLITVCGPQVLAHSGMNMLALFCFPHPYYLNFTNLFRASTLFPSSMWWDSSSFSFNCPFFGLTGLSFLIVYLDLPLPLHHLKNSLEAQGFYH